MAEKDIIAISNLLTDVIIPATDEEIERLNSGKLPFENLEEIIEFSDRNIKLIPGGSPANVVANASYLGAKCGLMGTLGKKDEIGEKYREDLAKNKIENLSHGIPYENSGVCYTLISSKGERHFLTRMGASSKFFIENEEKNRLLEYKLLHTSGYELETDREVVLNTVKFAKEKRKIVSFDLADEKVVRNEIKRNKEEFTELLALSDIIFANEYEARALEEDFVGSEISKQNIFVKKLGKKGSKIYYKGNECEIPLYECKPGKFINTNGAGDAYAAGFLVSYLKSGGDNRALSFREIIECGHGGSKLASQVCEIPGARLGEENNSAEYGKKLTDGHYHFMIGNLPIVLKP